MITKFKWDRLAVSKFWNNAFHSHLEDISFSKLNGDKLINLVRYWLAPEYEILDYGAGSGHLVEKLLANNFHVSAFDFASSRHENIDRLIKNYPNNFKLVSSNFDVKFDLIFLVEVIEHFLDEDFDEQVDRLCNHLRPGGLIIVTTPNCEDLSGTNVICPNCLSLFHPWQHQRSFHAGSLIDVFSKRNIEKIYLASFDFSEDAIDYELGKTCVNAINFSRSIEDQSMGDVFKQIEQSRRVYKQILDQNESGVVFKHRNLPPFDFQFGRGSTLIYVGQLQ